ncbi:MAG: heavy-metal-associated domain-containing protein [Gammaproteobacteria bacterium]
MIKNTVLVLLFAVYSISALASEKVDSQIYTHLYQGKVKGMVCAFCVYSVSKKIGQLPEIKADTVNVDLKSGVVNFRSKSKVTLKQLSGAFSDSGFKLVELNEVTETTLQIPNYETSPVLKFNLNSSDIKKYESVIESIGNIAAESLGKLVITAPKAVEIAILKPMIGGKQKIARVQYEVGKNIEIKLFLKSGN